MRIILEVLHKYAINKTKYSYENLPLTLSHQGKLRILPQLFIDVLWMISILHRRYNRIDTSYL